jgi:hypothetical protein
LISRALNDARDDLARGKLSLDEWATAGEFDRVRATLKAIWGVGPYALSHMMVLLGDVSTIPMDGEVLKYLKHTHFGGRNVSGVEAVRPYERFGGFRFLAYKCGRMARRINGQTG